MTAAIDYEAMRSRIGELAQQLAGQPNPQLSSRSELRFGRYGSLSVKIDGDDAGGWFDHEHKIGGGPLDLIQTRLGLDPDRAKEWAARFLGQPAQQRPRGDDGATAGKPKINVTYDYLDASGRLVFQVVRLEPKAFRQRRPLPDGGWAWTVKGVELVPYRLPTIVASDPAAPILVLEGEKDCDRAAALGLTATCNSGGAGKWRAEHAVWLKGRRVLIVPDNDEVRERHARQVAASLSDLAVSVKIVPLPGLPPKGDFTDWADVGGDKAAFLALAEAAPEWIDGAAEGEGQYRPEPDKAAASAQPPDLSEDSLALEFTRRHGAELRYVGAWSRWHRWDSTRWKADDTLAVFDLARTVCRDAAAACRSPSKALAIATARTVAAVDRLARSDRQHVATPDIFDAKPWILNTPGGIVDLKTGRLLPHDPVRLCTRITTAAPGGDCPTWVAFVDRATGGDPELAGYVRRVAGYCLTGSTSEHALFFVFGRGRNGKSTFVNVLASLLGDHAVTAPPETFTAAHGDRHPADLAMMAGARLVSATETEEGRPWVTSQRVV